MSGHHQDPVVLDEESSDTIEDQHGPSTSGMQQIVVKKDPQPNKNDNSDDEADIQNTDKRMSHDSDDESAASGEYCVEAIRAKRRNTKTGADEYYIKWKGYPEGENTWEPLENLKCPKLMQEFHEKEAAKRRRRKANKTNDLTPQPAKRLRRGPSDNGSEATIGDDERLFLEDDDDDEGDDYEDCDDSSRYKNRKSKLQKESKETRAEPVGLKGFERGLPLENILNACHGDDDKLYFFVTWAGRDELELVESDELEERAPRELCRWYRKRLYWKSNNDTNGSA